MTRPRPPLASLCVLVVLVALGVSRAHAQEDALDLVEVRSDTFPRVVVRLNASMSNGLEGTELTPASLNVVEDGQILSSVNLFPIRHAVSPASTILAIDVSGSMADQDRMPQAREAARQFLTFMRTQDRAGVVSFADQVLIRQALTNDRRVLTRTIDGLAAAGDTRLYDGLAVSIAEAARGRGANAVVLLTDGEDTGSGSSLESAIGRAVQAGVPVYTVGLGTSIKEEILKQIASDTGGRFYHAPGAQDLGRAFRLISRQISSQYEVYWLSSAQGPPGREVPVQMGLKSPYGDVGQVQFSYRLPRFSRPSSVLPEDVERSMIFVNGAEAPSLERVLLVALLFGLAVVALFSSLVIYAANRPLEARMARQVGGIVNGGAGAADAARPVLRNLPDMPLIAGLARIAAHVLPRQRMQQLRKSLAQAGFRAERHFQLFLAILLTLPVLLGIYGYTLMQARADSALRLRGMALGGQPLALLMALVLVIMGIYLPVLWLRRRVATRRRALLRSLPDALDLMTVGVSAGLSFDGAMLEIVQRWDNELSREFNITLNEMRMGTSRREALLNFAERTQLQDIRLFVAAVIQADELGSSLAQTLRTQSEQLRIRRRQEAEELAHKAPVKMLIPLVFLIFPAMFIVILGPAVPSLMQAIKSVSRGM